MGDFWKNQLPGAPNLGRVLDEVPSRVAGFLSYVPTPQRVAGAVLGATLPKTVPQYGARSPQEQAYGQALGVLQQRPPARTVVPTAQTATPPAHPQQDTNDPYGPDAIRVTRGTPGQPGYYEGWELTPQGYERAKAREAEMVKAGVNIGEPRRSTPKHSVLPDGRRTLVTHPTSTPEDYTAAARENIARNEQIMNRPLNREERYEAQEGLAVPRGTSRIQPYHNIGAVAPVGQQGPQLDRFVPMGNLHPNVNRDAQGALYSGGQMIQQAPMPPSRENQLRDMFLYGGREEKLWALKQIESDLTREKYVSDQEQSRIAAQPHYYAADRGLEGEKYKVDMASEVPGRKAKGGLNENQQNKMFDGLMEEYNGAGDPQSKRVAKMKLRRFLALYPDYQEILNVPMNTPQ